MLLLLSPAKRFATSVCNQQELNSLDMSTPRLRTQTQDLYKSVLECINKGKFQKLMSISDELTRLNIDRFRSWSPPRRNTKLSRPAVLYFKGDVYQELQAETLSSSKLNWLNKNLRILSGFHGLLRPLDVILPYRLEMGARLKNSIGENLYKFWSETVTKQLKNDLRDRAKVIVNLASQEYFKVIDQSQIKADIITVKFFFKTPAGYKQLGYPAKRARGILTRWITDHEVQNPDDILNFDTHGFSYSPEMSDSNNKAIAFVKQ